MPRVASDDHFLVEMILCAWCHAILGRLRSPRPRGSTPKVSHGICASCRQSQLAAHG